MLVFGWNWRSAELMTQRSSKNEDGCGMPYMTVDSFTPSLLGGRARSPSEPHWLDFHQALRTARRSVPTFGTHRFQIVGNFRKIFCYIYLAQIVGLEHGRMSKLFYVIGPSGSGKDSVMNYARQRVRADGCPVFAHRYITRDALAGGENHVAVSPVEFEARLRAGLFAMSWDSHGYRYGIGIEVKAWLQAGCNVVVNGSRGYLETARKRFSCLVPVLISVSPEVLRKRLIERGRESPSEVEERIRRASDIVVEEGPDLVRILNDGALELAGERFLELLSAKGSLVAR